MALKLRRFIKSAHRRNDQNGCEPSRFHFHRAEQQKRLLSMTRLGSRGSPTLDASNCIRIRCALATLIILMSCELTLIRFQELAGMMFDGLPLKYGLFWKSLAFAGGPRPAVREECMLMYASSKNG